MQREVGALGKIEVAVHVLLLGKWLPVFGLLLARLLAFSHPVFGCAKKLATSSSRRRTAANILFQWIGHSHRYRQRPRHRRILLQATGSNFDLQKLSAIGFGK